MSENPNYLLPHPGVGAGTGEGRGYPPRVWGYRGRGYGYQKNLETLIL